MAVSALISAIIDALKGGFGIVGDFVTMIRDTFTGLFIEATTSGGTTTYALSTFAVVALVMMGIAIVTGLGMLIFRRFFKRS